MQPTAPQSGAGPPVSPRCCSSSNNSNSSSSSSSSGTSWCPVPTLAIHAYSSTTPISSSPRHDLNNIDGNALLLLLNQLHRRLERGPQLEMGPPRGPLGAPSASNEQEENEGPNVHVSSSSNNNNSSSNGSSSSNSNSSSRDMLLQLLADEIMPQFFAHASMQHLVSLLQQHQHNPEALTQALQEEIYNWGKQEGPPLSTSGGLQSQKGPPGSSRGWRLSPRPFPGAPDGSPFRGLGQGTPSDGGPPRLSANWSPPLSPRRPRGPCASKEGPPALPACSQLTDTPHDEFVTPVGAPEEAVTEGAPLGALEGGSLEGGPLLEGAPNGSPLSLLHSKETNGAPYQYPALLSESDGETPAARGPPSWSAEGSSSKEIKERGREAPFSLHGEGPQWGAPIEHKGAPIGVSEEGRSVLTALRRAREERSLRAPIRIDEETEEALADAFRDTQEGMSLDEFRHKIVGPLLGLGPFLAGPLFRRIDTDDSGVVTLPKLKSYWRGRFVLKTKDPSLNDRVALPPLPTYGGPLTEIQEGPEGTVGAPEGTEGGPEGTGDSEASSGPEGTGTPRTPRGPAGAPVLSRGSIINFMGAIATRGHRIYPEDLRPWVLEVTHCAPDMAFLLDPQSEEYLEKYVDSVIARIMFYVDEDSKGWLSMRDLRRSHLVHVWCSLNPSVELSAIRKFFSYDHFYVLYCAFHELDEDDDFLLHRSDVRKYQGHSMSALVEGRLFSQAAHAFTCDKPQHINFNDWIWFMLAYHEITLPKSLRFWFDLFDLDGDGYIRDHELEAAFESQAGFLRLRDGKAQSYKEFVCQVSDALGLPTKSGISIRDILSCPLSSAFLFNCLIKGHILKAFDEGEPMHHLINGSPIEKAVFVGFTPFEIYAHSEYAAFTAQRYEEECLHAEGIMESGSVPMEEGTEEAAE